MILSSEETSAFLKKCREDKKNCRVQTFPPYKHKAEKENEILKVKEVKVRLNLAGSDKRSFHVRLDAPDIFSICFIISYTFNGTADIDWNPPKPVRDLKQNNAARPIRIASHIETSVSIRAERTVLYGYWLADPSDELFAIHTHPHRMRVVLITPRLVQ